VTEPTESNCCDSPYRPGLLQSLAVSHRVSQCVSPSEFNNWIIVTQQRVCQSSFWRGGGGHPRRCSPCWTTPHNTQLDCWCHASASQAAAAAAALWHHATGQLQSRRHRGLDMSTNCAARVTITVLLLYNGAIATTVKITAQALPPCVCCNFRNIGRGSF